MFPDSDLLTFMTSYCIKTARCNAIKPSSKHDFRFKNFDCVTLSHCGEIFLDTLLTLPKPTSLFHLISVFKVLKKSCRTDKSFRLPQIQGLWCKNKGCRREVSSPVLARNVISEVFPPDNCSVDSSCMFLLCETGSLGC